MQRREVLLALMGSLVALGAAPPPDAVSLTVALSGLRSHAGLVRICVSHQEQPFPACRGSDDGLLTVVPASQAEAVIPNLQPGRYAVAVIHDENGNGKLDTNVLGMPVEGFGFSNNPRIGFGPPRFAAAALTLAAPEDTGIRIRYFL
jgi:uncharacterized protein (DUF2141 family)